MTDFVSLGLLFVGVVGVTTLVVAVLALRSSQTAVWLAERRNEHLEEERDRLALLSEEHKSLYEELERERQQRRNLEEELDHERQQRLEAEQRAERAHQEALKGAAQQLRERMDHYLVELEEKEDTDPGFRLVSPVQSKVRVRTRH
jgi:biopolymer transport protein ExbB/TolQ